MFKAMSTVLQSPNTPEHILYENVHKIQPYIWHRWLSGNISTLGFALKFNTLKIPVEHEYYVVNQNVGGKVKFIKYPSKKDQDNDKFTAALMFYFNITLNKAKEKLNEYTLFKKEDELKKIAAFYDDFNNAKANAVLKKGKQ